jgi:hypothetical protein
VEVEEEVIVLLSILELVLVSINVSEDAERALLLPSLVVSRVPLIDTARGLTVGISTVELVPAEAVDAVAGRDLVDDEDAEVDVADGAVNDDVDRVELVAVVVVVFL